MRWKRVRRAFGVMGNAANTATVANAKIAVRAVGILGRERLLRASREWRRRTLRFAAGAETTLWLVAVGAGGLLVAWAGDATAFQHRAAAQMHAARARASIGLEAPGPVHGEPLGTLTIDRLGISAVVAEGSDEAVLRRAVGRLPSSALPGGGGNVALAGHRDTHFRRLERIRTGDLVTLETATGSYDYRVEWIRVVGPERGDLAATRGADTLTLVTCYPFRWVGDAPQRFVVRARQVASRPVSRATG